MVEGDVLPPILAGVGHIFDRVLRYSLVDQQWPMGCVGDDDTLVSVVAICSLSHVTPQCSGPGLALLAPAADRER